MMWRFLFLTFFSSLAVGETPMKQIHKRLRSKFPAYIDLHLDHNSQSRSNKMKNAGTDFSAI